MRPPHEHAAATAPEELPQRKCNARELQREVDHMAVAVKTEKEDDDNGRGKPEEKEGESDDEASIET
eukprot:s2899_g2.t1